MGDRRRRRKPRAVSKYDGEQYDHANDEEAQYELDPGEVEPDTPSPQTDPNSPSGNSDTVALEPEEEEEEEDESEPQRGRGGPQFRVEDKDEPLFPEDTALQQAVLEHIAGQNMAQAQEEEVQEEEQVEEQVQNLPVAQQMAVEVAELGEDSIVVVPATGGHHVLGPLVGSPEQQHLFNLEQNENMEDIEPHHAESSTQQSNPLPIADQFQPSQDFAYRKKVGDPDSEKSEGSEDTEDNEDEDKKSKKKKRRDKGNSSNKKRRDPRDDDPSAGGAAPGGSAGPGGASGSTGGPSYRDAGTSTGTSNIASGSSTRGGDGPNEAAGISMRNIMTVQETLRKNMNSSYVRNAMLSNVDNISSGLAEELMHTKRVIQGIVEVICKESKWRQYAMESLENEQPQTKRETRVAHKRVSKHEATNDVHKDSSPKQRQRREKSNGPVDPDCQMLGRDAEIPPEHAILFARDHHNFCIRRRADLKLFVDLYQQNLKEYEGRIIIRRRQSYWTGFKMITGILLGYVGFRALEKIVKK